MPTVHRGSPYWFFFYAGDTHEPPHVHVERDEKIAKFWLDPVRLQRSGGFRRPELHRMEQIIREARTELLEAWNDYFSS
jgi:hypothetical protein